MSAFDCFSKIICINLDRRADRWNECQVEFEKMGVKPERFSAISHPHGPTGCSLSHLTAMRQNQHLESVLHLEDDLCLKGDTSYLDEAYRSLPSDWEVLYLGGIVFPDEINADRIAPHIHRAKNVVCTHAIAFSKLGMARMLGQFAPQVRGGSRTPIDEFLRSVVQPDGKAFVITPMLFDQRPGYSDIAKRYGGPHNLFNQTNNKFK